MRLRYKISIVVLLFLTAVFFLVKFQAKRIVTSLIESSTEGYVNVKIGGVNIHPSSRSLRIKALFVLVRDHETKSYKEITIDNAYLDVASLWNFFTGGTLVIEKLETEGVDLFIYNNHQSDTASNAFSLDKVLQNIKEDAIRFDIRDIVFKDVNLTLSKDTLKAPMAIKHLSTRVKNLNLSADSSLDKKLLIEFGLPRQVITFPSELSMGFDSLSFTTTDNSIQFLNLVLNSPPSETNRAFHVQSNKVRVSNFSFESLFKTGKIKIDSVFLGKAIVSVDWLVSHTDQNKQVKKSGIPALPYVAINNVLFKELISDVSIRSGSVKNYFKIANASLLIDQFTHNPDSARIISSPNYNLLIAKYSTFLNDSSKSISFDTIQIQKHSLSLLNFAYKTNEQRKPLIQTPRFELKNVDWYELLINRKLKADELLISEPTIVTTIKRNEDNKSTSLDYFRVIELLNLYFKVSRFSIENAKAYVNVPDRKTEAVLSGYSTSIHVDDLINSGTVNQGMDAIRYLSFKDLRLTSPDFTILLGNFEFSKRWVAIRTINYQHSTDLQLLTQGLTLENVSWHESLNTLSLDGLGWDYIKAEIKGRDKENPPSEVRTRDIPNVNVRSIKGGNVDLLYSQHDLALTTSISQLNLNELEVGDDIEVSGVALKGNSIKLGTALNDVRVGEFSVTEQGGEINNIWINRNTAEYLNLVVGKLSFKAHLPDFLKQKYILNELLLDNIKARYNKQDSIQRLDADADGRLVVNNLNYSNKNLSIGSLYADAGPFFIEREEWIKNTVPTDKQDGKAQRVRLKDHIDSLVSSDKTTKSFRYSPAGIKPVSHESDTAAFSKRKIHLGSKTGGVKFYLSDIQSTTEDTLHRITSNINRIEFTEVDFATDKLIAWIKQGSLDNLVLNSDRAKNIMNVIQDNYHSASVHATQATVHVNETIIRVGKLDYDPETTSASIKQFEFRPMKDRKQFLEESFYQTNYMSTHIEAMSLNRLNLKRLIEDTVVHLGHITVSGPNLEIGRDKTHPFLGTGIKPLPTNAFKKLKLGFKVDTLDVTGGKVTYTEKSKITGQEGTIGFTNMNALVRNIKNIELGNSDSLYIRASTKFMDSALVKLRVRESYGDTLGGFLMTTNVSPFHTSILNKALVPMVSVDFKSGFVDTLHMRAIGREYLSLGTMKFLYRDLKVEFLDKNDTSRHSIKNQLLKFAANTFVIRTNNRDRIGDVYFERDRNRAVFQYWVKMILSGVTTSVGAKSNKKQIRKYLKSLNQKRLPPIKGDFDL